MLEWKITEIIFLIQFPYTNILSLSTIEELLKLKVPQTMIFICFDISSCTVLVTFVSM